MASVCPQRILNEAIRLLSVAEFHVSEEENIINTAIELESLSKALYRDGIHKIKEMEVG